MGTGTSMHRNTRLAVAVLVSAVAVASAAFAQTRPYIGFVYPAGGQQGTTFQIRLGGQDVDDVTTALVTGTDVTTRIVERCRRLNYQEQQLLTDQLKELKGTNAAGATMMAPVMMSETPMMTGGTTTEQSSMAPAKSELIARIEKRTADFMPTPACASIATLTLVEISIAPDAALGTREIRLVTRRGVSNPLRFCVGQLPEYTRKPMRTSALHVLGKEAASLRKRPPEEVEDGITLPCTVNGQIAVGEMNRYRFTARKGQHLVLTTQARALVPYIADAVPGWFQPVLALVDAKGQELAYDDHYRFNPDPTIFYDVPQDGTYTFAIYDSLYRGREDFVYRVTIGELPFVTSIFPLGCRAGEAMSIETKGRNIQPDQVTMLTQDAAPGVYPIVARRNGFVSNGMPFALDTLPECFTKPANRDFAHAQPVTLPVIINGRINNPGDWNVFRFTGKSNETIVAEVYARRLDSPLDSVLKLTDAGGKLLAFNDDREDPESGLNTHHADSYLTAKLPAGGTYYLQIGDTANNGGEAFAYRLRLSPPQPDFALRVVPSSASLRSKDGSATLTVYAIRKDGFAGAIKLGLREPPPGFTLPPVTLTGTQTVAQVSLRTSLAATELPLNLVLAGSAKIGDREIAHEVVPAEDRMQAFLWRHLVPATELKVLVYDPTYESKNKRVPPVCATSGAEVKPTIVTNATSVAANAATGTVAAAAAKAKAANQQTASRLRDLKILHEEFLLTDDFYCKKVAECKAAE